jgi:hypothetical protein
LCVVLFEKVSLIAQIPQMAMIAQLGFQFADLPVGSMDVGAIGLQ